jgi:RNA polymerase sigma-70 factor (ECF subfamily)
MPRSQRATPAGARPLNRTAIPRRLPPVERTNEQWVQDLRSSGRAHDEALAELRSTLLAGLRRALSGSGRRLFSAHGEDIVQEALLRILANLDTFRGLSRFTTWAQKIAVRGALTELRRRRWKNVSLDAMVEAGGAGLAMKSPAGGPAGQAELHAMMDLVFTMMKQELSQKQYTAIMAVAIRKVPLEEVASRMGTNRNALYKLIHDARLKLKTRLEREGVTLEQIMADAESG